MLLRENVQVYVYSTVERKVLMLKRIPQKAGYWQPVCGGIEKGESDYDAAKRELYEETGIGFHSELIELPFEFNYWEPKDGVMMKMRDTCFLLRTLSPMDISLSSEHESYAWCDFDEIKSLTNWEPILEVCQFIDKNMK